MLGASGDIGGFRVGRLIASDGFVDVYEAEQTSIGKAVRLELLDPSAPDELVQRALLEANLAAECPGIVEIIDVGRTERGAFRAVRAQRGESLRDALDAGVDSSRAVEIATRIAGALDALHGAGVTHRDIRPESIFLAPDGGVLLSPPALPPEAGKSTTITSAEPAAFTYVAPEVLRGGEPSPAADRYALAAILFEALTGEPLFRDADAAIASASAPDAPRASRRRPELSLAVDAPLGAGLATRPEERPATASALVDGVRAAVGPGDLPAPGDAAPDGAEASRPKLRRRLASLAAGAAAIVVVVLGVSALTDSEADAGLPPVPDGATPLGSDLSAPAAEVETVDCEGKPVRKKSRNCSLLQTGLPGAQLVAPEDGSIKGWAVRGAKGLLSLQVFRARDDGYYHAYVTQVETVPDTGVHYFEADTKIDSGDVVAVQVYEGSGIGVRRDVEGATTKRWLPPQYDPPPRPSDLQAGSGFDHEVQLRVDYLPGVSIDYPEQLDGAAAASAPDGKVLKSIRVALPGGEKGTVAAVRVGDRIYLDLEIAGRRTSRMEMTDYDPDGKPDLLDARPIEPGYYLVSFWWLNPGETIPLEHYADIDGRALTYVLI